MQLNKFKKINKKNTHTQIVLQILYEIKKQKIMWLFVKWSHALKTKQFVVLLLIKRWKKVFASLFLSIIPNVNLGIPRNERASTRFVCIHHIIPILPKICLSLFTLFVTLKTPWWPVFPQIEWMGPGITRSCKVSAWLNKCKFWPSQIDRHVKLIKSV